MLVEKNVLRTGASLVPMTYEIWLYKGIRMQQVKSSCFPRTEWNNKAADPTLHRLFCVLVVRRTIKPEFSATVTVSKQRRSKWYAVKKRGHLISIYWTRSYLNQNTTSFRWHLGLNCLDARPWRMRISTSNIFARQGHCVHFVRSGHSTLCMRSGTPKYTNL